jgi:hypothetical protein
MILVNENDTTLTLLNLKDGHFISFSSCSIVGLQKRERLKMQLSGLSSKISGQRTYPPKTFGCYLYSVHFWIML